MNVQRFVIPTLTLIITLGACNTALATISAIQSDLCPNPACLPGAVHPIVAGSNTSMVVKGQFVDLSTRVEITGSGVDVSFGTRTGGSNSNIVVRFNVHSNADLGERTVKLRYAIETNGPDTFKVRVVRGGNVQQIQRRVAGALRGTTQLVDVSSVPVNQRVTLVFSGTRLGNARIAPRSGLSNPQRLSTCTETRCEFEVEFTLSGPLDVNLFDGSVQPNANTLLYKFFYGGAKRVTVSGNVTGQSTSFISPVLISGGSASPTPFADVAPRANIGNLFRRNGNSITVNGETFLQVDDHWCNGLRTPSAGSSAMIVTVPDLIWGVSNVGTAQIGVGFASQLSANNQVLDTQTTPALSLGPGATQDFRFHRARSTVRVIRFAPPVQQGCFVNPRSQDFFEDPRFTVTVDVGHAVPEAAINQVNNVRTY